MIGVECMGLWGLGDISITYFLVFERGVKLFKMKVCFSIDSIRQFDIKIVFLECALLNSVHVNIAKLLL